MIFTVNPVIRPTIVLLTIFTIVTGVIYPLAVWLFGQSLFPHQANGSLLKLDDRVIGSELIAQPFHTPEWFWPRPSAVGYDASSSGGSNLAPTNPALLEAVGTRVSALNTSDSTTSPSLIPVDLVTSAASGLDPHLSPAAAFYQVPRIAKARNIEPSLLQKLIHDNTEPRTFGLLGEPRVNVLLLNIKLQKLSHKE